MTGECKSTRKRAYPDENTDTSTPATPRKRQAAGSSRPSTSTTTDNSSENTPEPCVVLSPYFSPPKKGLDATRKKRLLAASHSLLNENSRFIKRPLATAKPVGIRERGRPNAAETTTAITEHIVSELSRTRSRKRKTRRGLEPVAPNEPTELSADEANLTALEKQVRACVINACL